MSNAAASDKALWNRAVSGDEQGFVAVYDRYAQRLLTYAYRRTGSVHRAEDTVSLVMLEAWRRRREVRFGADGTIAGWLFLTARYVLANEARAARRHRHALARIAQLAPPVTDDLDRHLVDDERLRRALAALTELSSRDQDVLELAVWSGLSESEMAEALGVPVGTFKSRLSRARRRLSERCDMPHKPLTLVRLAINSEELQ
ncbi:MAG: RNA polymerase sigma factor [Acidimicrobiales bacterium]